jgi:hypothetical protein
MPNAGNQFDSETLALLKRVFEDAVALVPPPQQTPERKIAIATRILNSAAAGERDPVRLREIALLPFSGT